MCKVVGNPQKISFWKVTSEIIWISLKKNGKVENFACEKLWEPCSFGWEMVGDEDLKIWEMAGNLLFSTVWEP